MKWQWEFFFYECASISYKRALSSGESPNPCYPGWVALSHDGACQNKTIFIWIPTVNDSQKHGSRAGEVSKTTGSGYRFALAAAATHRWLHCIYSGIFNPLNSPYLHSIVSIAIIETPECQHCIVWEWAAFGARRNGKFPTIKKESLI